MSCGSKSVPVVVGEGVPVGRAVPADADERADAPRVRPLVRPALARAPGAAVVPRAAELRLLCARSPGLEEDRAARAEAVRLDRRVAAVHLDVVDEPERDERQVGGAADVVVQPHSRQVDGRVGGRRAADGGGRRGAEAAGLGDRDARLAAEDVLGFEAGADETVARDDRAGDAAVPGRDRVAQGVAADVDLLLAGVVGPRARREARRRHREQEERSRFHESANPSERVRTERGVA